MEAIIFDKVTKILDKIEVLSSLSFKIQPGSIWSIVGSSGVGKSTLLKLVAGVEPVTSGNINVFGTSPQAAARNGMFGYAFQEDLLLPWLTIKKNIGLPLEFSGIPNKEKAPMVEEHCKRAHLDDLCDRYPDQLSGGQRRRTALARAVIRNPKIILMDEPFSALDEPLRRKLLIDYERLIRSNNLTAIFVTHSVDEAIFLGDNVLVISGNPSSGDPGHISGSFRIPFEHPRTMSLFQKPEFIALREDLLKKFQ